MTKSDQNDDVLERIEAKLDRLIRDIRCDGCLRRITHRQCPNYPDAYEVIPRRETVYTDSNGATWIR